MAKGKKCPYCGYEMPADEGKGVTICPKCRAAVSAIETDKKGKTENDKEKK